MLNYADGIEQIAPEAIIDLYRSVNWTAYTDDPDNLLRALDKSTYIVICREGDKVVGLARSLSDDNAIHYLQDILVRPEYQRRGIGRELFNRCLARFDHVRTHVLLTDGEERQRLFYESLGYRNTKDIKKFPLNCFVIIKGVKLE
jgi:ribosomal protein S18 acetylase RimI-like enzyme